VRTSSLAAMNAVWVLRSSNGCSQNVVLAALEATDAGSKSPANERANARLI